VTRRCRKTTDRTDERDAGRETRQEVETNGEPRPLLPGLAGHCKTPRSRGTSRHARRRDYRSCNGIGTTPIMRMPWSKSGNLQLDLLDAPAAPEAAPEPPTATGTDAGLPSMVATTSLYEDANNPRTEIPDADLDELAEDIRQHGILQPIAVHHADAKGRYQLETAVDAVRAR
jgi:hypothetical protein